MALTLPNLGLKVWNAPTDPYNSSQLADNWYRVDEHDHSPGKGRPLATNSLADLSVTQTKLANAAVGTAQLADANVTAAKLADAARLGLSDGASVRRGKANIATAESTGSTTYVTLATPDRVSSIVLPTDGLIFVGYQATWQNSVTGAGKAAIFLGANQLKIANGGSTVPTVQEATCSTNAALDRPLATWGGGLLHGDANFAWGGDVTTGETIGMTNGTVSGYGVTPIFAAAGTYDVSIQFKASSGTVTAKNRKLWVWTISF